VIYRLNKQFKRHLPHRWLYVSAFLILLFAVPTKMAFVKAQENNDTANNVIAVQPMWPTNGVAIDGKTAFIAQIPDQAGSSYDMFWYVDDGSWNWMGGAPNDLNVKQATVDVSGWNWKGSDKNYTIHFVAVLHSDKERIFASVPIVIGPASSAASSTAATKAAQAAAISATANPQAVKNIVTAPRATLLAPSTITSSMPLYVSPNNPAVAAAANTSDPNVKRILSRLAGQATATWFGGWNSNITGDVSGVVTDAANHSQLPTLVAYNIPQRDCGSYSSGGASNNGTYLSWVQGMANGIGSRPAIVILEPDALAGMDCLSSGDQASRVNMIAQAVNILKAGSKTRVYLDAGHPNWKSASDIAARLNSANIAAADGFSLNVSNFYTTNDNLSYGNQISGLVSGKHFVVDTSRNGNGNDNGYNWCNPHGRAYGQTPSTNTGNSLVDNYLWVKTPGESDGQCNSGPAAGVWWQDYALELGRDSNW
jgi:endoglucanase